MKTFYTLSRAFENPDKVSVGFCKPSTDQTRMCCPEKAAFSEAVSLSNGIVADISVFPPDSASDAQTRRQGCHSDRRIQGNRIWGSPAHGQTRGTCYHRYVIKSCTRTGIHAGYRDWIINIITENDITLTTECFRQCSCLAWDLFW